MSKLTSRILFSFTLAVVFAAPALAQDTHNVWSTRPIAVNDGATGAHYSSFVSGNASLAWTQATPWAYAHALAIVTPALKYDFMLISTTGSDGNSIMGRWTIRRNGVIVCSNCIGKAYGLSAPIGSGFKIYVGTPAAFSERWHYGGSITNRYDF